MSPNDPTDCGSAGHPMTCNCYYHVEGDGGVLPAPTSSDVRVALEKILGEASAFSEGSPQSDAFFRIQGLAQRALSEADAALVVPSEHEGLLGYANHIAMQRCVERDKALHDLAESAALVAGLRQELKDAEANSDEMDQVCASFAKSDEAKQYRIRELEAEVAGLRQALAQCEQDVLALPVHGHAEHESGHPRALVFKVDVLKLLEALAGRTETP